MRNVILPLLLIFSIISASDQIPAPPQEHPVLIKNGTLHTVSNGVMERVDILFENGLITRIEDNIVPNPAMEVIDAEGKHIYPGLIASVSTLGLVEVSAVRSTADYNEVGQITPEVRANVSYNPDSELIPVTRSNGVLFVNTMPVGGRVTGQSSLMIMDGWTWEDATYNYPTAMHINWPNMWINTNPNAKTSVSDQEKNRRKALKELDDLIDRVRQYQKMMDNLPKSRPPDVNHDLRLEAMIPYVNNEKPFFIHASDARQIEAAVRWSDRQQVKIVIVGGWDAWRVTDILKNNNVPVIVEGVLRMPRFRYSDYREAYALPAKLYEAGVSFCISTAGNAFQAAHVRDLPNHAAMAAAFGLPMDVALRAITLSAADILGVGDQIGSLDVGKDASLFIADGDILEITTHVEQAFIRGAKIDMNDKHKTLYNKYQEKYKQLGILGED